MKTRKLSKKQSVVLKELINGDRAEVGYGGGAGGAKSWTIVEWLFIIAVRCKGSKTFIGRRELKRLRQSTLQTFYRFSSEYGFDHLWVYNGQDNYILFENGSRIDLLDLARMPSDPMYNRFGSLEYTCGAIDESQEVDRRCIEILHTRVGRWRNDIYEYKGRILETFNPDKGHIKERYWIPFKNDEMPDDRVFIRSLVTDNPFIPKEYIEKMRKTTGVTYERLFLGNFDYDEEGSSIFDQRKVDDMFQIYGCETGEIYLSADVAMKGKDSSVFIVWDGMMVLEILLLKENTGREFVSRIEALRDKYNIPASNVVYDSVGVGDGMSGYMPDGAFEFRGGASPMDRDDGKPYIKNLRSQCFQMLAEKIKDGDVNAAEIKGEYRERLKTEFQYIQQDRIGQDVKFQIVSKSKMEKSPDIADAMSMRMVFELKPVKEFEIYAGTW